MSKHEDTTQAAGGSPLERRVRRLSLTRWFCALTEPPIRAGWYECRNASTREDDDLRWRRYWNGKRWLARGPRSRQTAFGTWTEANQWRGLKTPNV